MGGWEIMPSPVAQPEAPRLERGRAGLFPGVTWLPQTGSPTNSDEHSSYQSYASVHVACGLRT